MKAYCLGSVSPRFVVVTAATNANPIVLTVAAGLLAGATAIDPTTDVVTVVGVTGNTAANGSYAPGNYTIVDATHLSLVAAGNGAYISGGTASAPQRLTTAARFPVISGLLDATKVVSCKLLVTPAPAGTASLYLGVAGLNQATLANVIRPINPPPVSGIFDYYEIDLDGTNVVVMSDYYIDAAKPGTEAAIVTFWVR
ncbi:MAG: hypothetical protein NVS9B2_30180 [Steroidobacteraceae bacterium]